MRTIVLAVIASMTGCGASGDPTPIRGQSQALAMLWSGAFGETRTPPEVYWRRDNCDVPNGQYSPDPACTFNDDGESVAGLADNGGKWIEVGAPWESGMISDTAFAHELLHASIGDPDHRSPRWTTIDDLNAMLRSNGL